MVKGINKAGKPVALVLGGIVNHIILIEKLQKRGFYVILVDYLDDPPAKAVADEHAQISTFDENAIENLAVERNASLIINANLEHVNAVAIRVSEKLGLPVPYSSEVALNVSDKQRMKQIMKLRGIPTTKFCCISAVDELEQGLKFPLFVKPVDGKGSTAVNRATDINELNRCLLLACEASDRGQAIVEEEALGKEYSVYAFVSRGIAHVLLIAEKYIEVGNGETLTRCIATLTPVELSKKTEYAIQDTAQAIADAFSFVNTPMFMQVKINEDEVNVIEFAGRIAGGYSYRTIELTTGFDIFEGTIEAFLGNAVEVPKPAGEKQLAIYSLIASPGVFGSVKGVEELVQSGALLEFLQVRKAGTRLSADKANAQRVGFALVQGDSRDALKDNMRKCFKGLRVLDENGKDITLPNTSLGLME